MGSRRFPSETEGEGGALKGEGGVLFARYDLFFPLDCQVARISYPKKCLTVLRMVVCDSWVDTRSS